MALLQSLNSVRGKLREEQVGSIAADSELTTVLIQLINDAGSEILEGDDWPFDVRHDGKAFFPSSQSGTNGTFGIGSGIYDTLKTALLVYLGDTDSGEVFADKDLAGFSMTDPVVARIIPTGTSYPNTSFKIANVEQDVLFFTLTLQNNLHTTPITGAAWTTYANEIMLPSTVKAVTSVSHEEQDVPLEFVGRGIDFDSVVPRQSTSFSSSPEVVFVGSTVTTTGRSGSQWTNISAQTAQTGKGMMIWPIPDDDLQLSYSYRVQHSDLAAATDVWAGVPNDVIHLIEWRAVQMALGSVIQNDEVMARNVERQVEKRRARAQIYLNAQPNRRRVPPMYGQHAHGNSRRRWASQTVAAP